MMLFSQASRRRFLVLAKVKFTCALGHDKTWEIERLLPDINLGGVEVVVWLQSCFRYEELYCS